MDLLMLFIGAIFVNNILLARFLGCCPFLGVSTKSETAKGMGIAVIFVILMASIMTWLAYNYVLVPLKLEYLFTLSFILIIASLVQFVELVLKKVQPVLYKSLGIFLPLITTNCAVLGVAIMVQRMEYSLTESLLYAVAASSGFLLALVLMSGIRERLDSFRLPKSMAGTPLALIMAGLMSMTFMAFKGMI